MLVAKYHLFPSHAFCILQDWAIRTVSLDWHPMMKQERAKESQEQLEMCWIRMPVTWLPLKRTPCTLRGMKNSLCEYCGFTRNPDSIVGMLVWSSWHHFTVRLEHEWMTNEMMNKRMSGWMVQCFSSERQRCIQVPLMFSESRWGPSKSMPR